MSEYLDLLNKIFTPNEEGWDVPEFMKPAWAETYQMLRSSLKLKGIEVGEFGELGDGIWCVFDDGELKVTAYISIRGRLYQAGAFDGTKGYFKTNVYEEIENNNWFETEHPSNYVCTSIATDAWAEIKEYQL